MEDISQKIKKDILNASYEAEACHIGSALSCVDILVTLFYNHDLKDNDVFLFGKASGVATYYAILADKGHFPKDKLSHYLKNYPLPSVEVPGVVHSFGSVGHGLSVACGMALGNRNRKVYILLSDGDCQEGSTYEAVLFARQHKLDNLYVIVDDNGLQACGATKDILQLDDAFEFMKKSLKNVSIVKTVKGKGIDFMENDYTWHYKNLDKELLEKALKQI
jgi:transketolase